MCLWKMGNIICASGEGVQGKGSLVFLSKCLPLCPFCLVINNFPITVTYTFFLVYISCWHLFISLFCLSVLLSC